MKDRFDLENEIMDCWGVVSDLSTVLEYLDDDFFEGMSPAQQDKLSNLLLGMIEMYDVKFFKMFNTFSDCIPDLKDSIENNLEMYVFDDEDEDSQIELRLNDVPPEGWDNPSAWDKATRG